MSSDPDRHFMRARGATMPLPGSSSRATVHARSASEGTRQSISPGRLLESHFDSGFPWKKGSPRMRLPSPLRSPELEHVEVASFISGSENMTGVGAGIAVLARKPDVGYPRFSGIPVSDANSPLTPSTDQTVQVPNRSSTHPRTLALVPPNMGVSPPNNHGFSPPPPILPPLRRAFSQDSYIADRPYSDGAQYLDLSPPHPFPPAISTPSSSSKHATPPVDQPQTPSPPSSPSPPPIVDPSYRMTMATGHSGHSVSALLGPNAFGVRSDETSDYATTAGFRDSAYTTGTSTNEWKNEVPIRWTPSSQPQRESSKGPESIANYLAPGGWNPTPVEEKEEDVATGFGDRGHNFPIPSYQRQRTPERHNADAPRSPEIIEQEDMGRLGRVGVVGVYGEQEPEQKRRPSRTTPPQERRPLRVSDSSVTRVPPNKLKRLSEGWVMVNVENSYRRPPVTEEPVPVPSTRRDVDPRARAQRMLRGRSHSDPQLSQTAEQHEHGQHARPRPSQSQKNLSSRDGPSKPNRDRDRSEHRDRDRDRDRDRVENRSGHSRPTPRRTSGSNPSPGTSKGTTSQAAKAIAMIDAAGTKEKGRRDSNDNYSTYPGVKQNPVLPRKRTLKKLLNRGEPAEKLERKSSKSKKHTSSKPHKVV